MNWIISLLRQSLESQYKVNIMSISGELNYEEIKSFKTILKREYILGKIILLKKRSVFFLMNFIYLTRVCVAGLFHSYMYHICIVQLYVTSTSIHSGCVSAVWPFSHNNLNFLHTMFIHTYTNLLLKSYINMRITYLYFLSIDVAQAFPQHSCQSFYIYFPINLSHTV